jgi:hypothetical protein
MAISDEVAKLAAMVAEATDSEWWVRVPGGGRRWSDADVKEMRRLGAVVIEVPPMNGK